VALAPLLFVSLLASSAQGEGTRLYGSASMGFSLPDADISGAVADSGANGDFGAAIGVQTSDVFRWDIAEVHYVNFGGTDLRFGTSRSSVSLGTAFNWGFFSPSERFHPYFSLGVAAARLRYQSNASSQLDDDWGFEWNVGGGVDLAVSDQVRTGIRYRYRRSTRSTERRDYVLSAHSLVLEIAFMGGP
jgi:opacity protein-like surface antigen